MKIKIKESSRTGINFAELLQLVFIVLKLLKIIGWSWIWVLSPTWISLLAVVLVTVFLCIFRK